MKNGILSFLVIMLLSCNKANLEHNQELSNNVLILKVDFLTSVFEGGKELEFSSSADFSISTIYNEPGDFGDVQLYYSALNEKIFDGTIIWMGTGKRSYPETIDIPTSFSILDENLPLPEINTFHNVMYSDYAYYPDTIKYSDIWGSINNLEIVSNYRNSNPNGRINLFLYTPSVGVGNPADWDWYMILKN